MDLVLLDQNIETCEIILYTLPMHILIFIAILACVGLAFLIYRNAITQSGPTQTDFLKGAIPTQLPDGLYQGSSPGYKGSWKGKKFNSTDHTGINIFESNGQRTEEFSFKTYVAKGLADKAIDVIKIDYNISGNPIWLRMILDEVVETKPGVLLGKLHIHIGPFSYALGYFTLQK